jgi:para-aminobenzoate synthetase component 1
MALPEYNQAAGRKTPAPTGMRSLIQGVATAHTPESLTAQLRAGHSPVVLLRTGQFDSSAARYSLVVAQPFLVFRSFGSRCETCRTDGSRMETQFGNPWHLLDALMSRYELLEEIDWPFPLGGAFGYWGYDLKHFTEPKLPRRAMNDLSLPDCHVGFFDSLVVFDHHLDTVTVISTGLDVDGSRSPSRASAQAEFWAAQLATPPVTSPRSLSTPAATSAIGVRANLSRAEFLAAVERAQQYIRAGDIYQVNLSQRLTAPVSCSGWELFERLAAVSPAPFAAYLSADGGADCGPFEIASSSPEQFLRLSGAQVVTRPIKGTRPRHAETTRDAQLAYELQTSPKELAELVMITDLLRNDLGKICEYGSVQTPALAQLEKFAQVQHLVSTVEGRLRGEMTHLGALAFCFPGGSITGAPKFRAMEIIDELEPIARGPYCGAIGYLGFNRESQLSITIRTAITLAGTAYFAVGAGIVADSIPAAEYQETIDKARGFFEAMGQNPKSDRRKH